MSLNKSRLIIDGSGRPTIPLLQLLELLDIPHDGMIASILEACRSQWLQPGKERWEFAELYPDKKQQAYPLLKQLGCIDSCHPQKLHYDAAILLGGHYSRMLSRMDFLQREWKRGVRFKKLIILTGARPLDFKTEIVTDNLSTEKEMILFLLKSSHLENEWEQIVVDVPMQRQENGLVLRPNTSDTIREWIKLKPGPGAYLAISSQPFIGYHDACLRGLSPKALLIETVGPQVDKDTLFSIFLYNLQRWIEQAHIFSL